ncbi:MAG: peptidoglycan DD-metalloendopeptidase family protein [Candidatus Omnitrophica bacterium]|nr:peptidoglycan DD-metalloendopeptidase family protein [Candidatus Omnitrophota bacterium]
MKRIAVMIFMVLGLVGCATAPYIKPAALKAPLGIRGIYHKVEKGQTLWKISKIYGVDLEELARVNRIADTTAVEVGQQVFIPNRSQPQTQAIQYDDNDDFIWPLRGRVTGTFGQNINNMLNKGINIAPYGSVDVLASRSGRIVFVDKDFAGLGKTIIIEHSDGLFTVYGRNAEVFVQAGDIVRKGTNIAKAGSGGRDRGIYLHFEVRRGHLAQNPLFYLP